MIFRGLDSDKDWQFGRGKASYLTEQKAIEENIRTRLLSFFGDCFFSKNEGIDWFRLLGSKGTQAELELACKETVLRSYGVVKITDLSSSLDNRKLTLSYTISTIYSENFTDSVEV